MSRRPRRTKKNFHFGNFFSCADCWRTLASVGWLEPSAEICSKTSAASETSEKAMSSKFHWICLIWFSTLSDGNVLRIWASNFYQTFLLLDCRFHLHLKLFLLSAIVEPHKGPENALEKKRKKKSVTAEVDFGGLKLIDFVSTRHQHNIRKMFPLVRQTFP